MPFSPSPYIKAPHRGEVFCRQLLIAGEVCATPVSWKGHTVRFYVSGGDCRVLFASDATIAITVETISARNGSTLVLTPSGSTAPLTLKDWSFIDIYVEANDSHFQVVGSNDTGYWHGHVSDFGRGKVLGS